MSSPGLTTAPDVTDSNAPAPGRTRRNRGSEVIRSALINAAIAEFAACGFEGASTRRIAEAANAHQSQITYHFDSKDELWKRCVELLIEEIDQSIRANLDRADDDPRAVLAATIRGLVQFMARRPELNRIMIHEATRPTERLRWLVATHLADRHAALVATWEALTDRDLVAPIEPDLVYHILLGAASLLYTNAPEAELLGTEPADPDLVDRHAEALVALFLRSS